MNLDYSAAGVDYEEALPTNETLGIRARNIRRERTGVHALVAITLGGTILESDTFNIDRREERTRLAKAAHQSLSTMLQTAVPLPTLLHTLQLFLLEAPQRWEERRFTLEEFNPEERARPIGFALGRYIIEGGGTILFGPPESSKSMMAQIMAVCLAQGISEYWETGPARPVLFLNLERPRNTFLLREQKIRTVLGVTGKSGVTYLHGRGAGLQAISKSVTRFITDNPNTVIFQDSISRSQLGSLKEDETANRIVDQLNAWGTWMGVAHTPRANVDHSYGSVHFEAGEDIGIKVASERRGDFIGVRLEVTKMNDAKKPAAGYYSLEFAPDDSGLVGFKDAKATDFPGLVGLGGDANTQAVVGYIQEHGEGTAMEIHNETGIERTAISRILAGYQFLAMAKQGRNQPYRMRQPGES